MDPTRQVSNNCSFVGHSCKPSCSSSSRLRLPPEVMMEVAATILGPTRQVTHEHSVNGLISSRSRPSSGEAMAAGAKAATAPLNDAVQPWLGHSLRLRGQRIVSRW